MECKQKEKNPTTHHLDYTEGKKIISIISEHSTLEIHPQWNTVQSKAKINK